MSVMFRNQDARRTIADAYERFRSTILCPTSTRTIATRHGETHVLVAGNPEGTPLVLFHGALASSAHAVAELGPLLERHHVFAPDIIGQSVKSADVRLDLRGPAYGEWAADVLDGLGLARADVYGVSWGGFVALKLAESAPARIDRLVLLAPAGVVAGSAWQGFREVGLPLLLYRLFPSEARLRRFVSSQLTTPDDAWVAYFGEALRSYNLDLRAPPLFGETALAGFARPVLVFAGESDVNFPGGPLLARLSVMIPAAELELLAGTKHGPPTDAAFRQKMADRITRFFTAAPADRERHGRGAGSSGSDVQ